jgi:hypothetical protein
MSPTVNCFKGRLYHYCSEICYTEDAADLLKHVTRTRINITTKAVYVTLCRKTSTVVDTQHTDKRHTHRDNNNNICRSQSFSRFRTALRTHYFRLAFIN